MINEKEFQTLKSLGIMSTQYSYKIYQHILVTAYFADKVFKFKAENDGIFLIAGIPFYLDDNGAITSSEAVSLSWNLNDLDLLYDWIINRISWTRFGGRVSND